MKFVFVTKGNKLNPMAERVKEENYDVSINPTDAIYKPLVITDTPLDPYREYGFCVGHSKFSEALMADDYNRVVLVMSGLNHTSEEPNVDVSCWFNGIDFVLPAIVSVNENRFMEGDLGRKVESMGGTTYICKSSSKLFKEVMLPLKDVLRKVSYCGFLTVECELKEENSCKVARLTPYFKYDLLYAFLEGVQEELGKAFHGIATGEKKEFKYPELYTIAVRISIPPYPYKHILSKVSMLDGLCPKNERHVWLQNAMRDSSGIFPSGVGSVEGAGVIATVTARGCSVRECRRRVYRTVRNLSIEDMQYRRDIGVKAKDMFEQLKVWGWA